MNGTYTKILKCLIVLCPRFSETFPFPLYMFGNDSVSVKINNLASKRKFCQNITTNQHWKLSKEVFRPKPDKKNCFSPKRCSIKNFRTLNSHYFALKLRERLQREQNSEVCRGLGWVKKIFLLAQTIVDNIYKSMSGNQAKSDRARNPWYFFRIICKQAIIKLSLACSFRKMFFIGQNLKHVHMT